MPFKGMLAFSSETEGEGLPQDQLTFLHRCVKMELQASPYELRGSRRAAVLSDFIQVGSILVGFVLFK